MDQQDNNQGSPQDQNMNQDEKTTFKGKFKGTDETGVYETGSEYTLQKWEKEGKTYLSMEDGTSELSYDTSEDFDMNWETLPNEEEGMESEQGSEKVSP